ncbi:Cytochrome P450 4C1 [Frankliniella fusca]|uniref:Cytochrome P450 4C1 n=1 Tax=Frankliniella fusca TaxID=407009 RepID=A0AAE1HLA6_9NEOP|nr:Cytochrome P450 4C1 [Frankliniella fusca]
MDPMDAVLLLAVAVALLLWRALPSYRKFRRLELSIPGPPSLPLVGNLLDVALMAEEDRLRVVLALWGGRHDQLSRISLAGQLVVFVSDPDHVGVVLKDPRFALKPSFFYGFMERVSGRGILTSNGRHWKQHRTAMLPAFHPSVVDGYVAVYAEEAAALATALRQGGGGGAGAGPEELRGLLTRALARASVRSILESDVLAEDEPYLEAIVRDVGRCLMDVNERTFTPWLWPYAVFALSAAGRRLAEFERVTDEFGFRVLTRIRARRRRRGEQTQSTARRRTLTEVLVESTTADGAPTFTDDEILAEGKTVFGASVETNVATLSFVLQVLSVLPDVQDRVLAELDGVVGGTPGPGPPTPDQLHRLEYMDCVIKETLRLLPSFPFVARMVPEETELAGKVLPAGTVLVVNLFGLHRDPRHHARPLRFDPDRFRRANPDPGRHPSSYLPFSAGPRNCIGQRYAMMTIKTVLATVLSEFRVEAADDNGVRDPSDFTLTFFLSLHLVGGVSVRFVPRKSKEFS